MKSIDSLNYRYSQNKSWKIYNSKRIQLYGEHFHELSDHIGKLSKTEAEQISEYMSIFSEQENNWMSNPPDPMNESIIVEKPDGSDGIYRWSGLMHYLVETYQIDPPKEFRNHVHKQLSSGKDLISESNSFFDSSNPNGYHNKLKEYQKIDETDFCAKFLLYP